MTKARLIPLFFPGRDSAFDAQVAALRNLLADEAEVLEPAALGSALPATDAVVFPQVLGDAYKLVPQIRDIAVPMLIMTSEFGTVSMWDWEIGAYLRSEGIETLAPYSLEQARRICRALAVKSELRNAKFLVFQDNPGEGFQASIFKRFYWWEDECSARMRDKFGITIMRKSFRELGEAAKQVSDKDAEAVLKNRNVAVSGLSSRSLYSAVKLYLAVKREIEQDEAIHGAGINCLNESHFSDTTPCLAWNLLYEDKKLIWGCEADTMSMLSKYILHKSLDVPIMMTNLYPFLMGQAALKHEKIEKFPDVANPQNCLLMAHCGYLGVLPRPFAAEWTLKPKVLAIVDENSAVIDARLPEGEITLGKLHPRMDKISVAQGRLESYAQYPGSDCRNGAVIRVKDGHRLMNSLTSHHYLLMTGHQQADIHFIAKIFELEVEVI